MTTGEESMKRKAVTGDKLGLLLCSLLGLDAQWVRRIVVDCEVGSIALVTVTSIARIEDGTTVEQQYRVVSLEGAEGEP